MSNSEIQMLLKLREYLIESIAQASDEVQEIDRRLAVLGSSELEADLNQAVEVQS